MQKFLIKKIYKFLKCDKILMDSQDLKLISNQKKKNSSKINQKTMQKIRSVLGIYNLELNC